jgi:hypothetical protein
MLTDLRAPGTNTLAKKKYFANATAVTLPWTLASLNRCDKLSSKAIGKIGAVVGPVSMASACIMQVFSESACTIVNQRHIVVDASLFFVLKWRDWERLIAPSGMWQTASA